MQHICNYVNLFNAFAIGKIVLHKRGENSRTTSTVRRLLSHHLEATI